MKFKIGDKVRVKKSAGIRHGGKEYTIHLVGVDGFITMEELLGQDEIGQGWLQLTLESPKLTLRLSQSGLKLKVKILEQNNDLRYIGEIVRHNEYSIISDNEPEIYIGKTLFIKGKDYGYDKNKISYEFNSQVELDEFVEALRVMMMSEVLK